MVRFASHVVGEGRSFTRAAAEKGLEGVVAKRRDSRYQPGKRTRDWLKIKLRREQELVVAGWLPGRGTHEDLGSLIVAVNADGRAPPRRPGRQRHRRQDAARRCWTRWNRSAATTRRLIPVPRLPEARWVEPRIVIRAEFAEWTTDGLLRQAAFKGVEWIGSEAGHSGGGHRRRRGSSPRAALAWTRVGRATPREEGRTAQAGRGQGRGGDAGRAAALDAMEREGHLAGRRP